MHLHRDTRNYIICGGCVKSTLKLFVQEQSTMPVMACWCYTYTISVGSPVRARWACSGSFQFLNRTTLLTATRSGYSKPRMIKIVSFTSFLLKITMYIYIVFYILLKLLHFECQLLSLCLVVFCTLLLECMQCKNNGLHLQPPLF